MTPVCSITFLSIFLRRDTIVFWKMCLLYWLTNLTHQTHYREKTTREAFCREWRHGDWTLKIVSQIAFCFILTTGFAETILVPILLFSFSIIAVAVFITLFFLLLLSPWLCCVLVVITIDAGVIATAIVVIFVALLLLLHRCFTLFNSYYVSSCFQCYFCVIVISIVLLLLFFRFPR